MYFSIIIPLYNERESIIKVLERLRGLSFPSYVTCKEIIVVDDCSGDGSWDVVRDYIHGREGFELLRHDVNRGKGAAVRTGVQASKGNVILIQDADLELSPEDIPSMLEAMHQLDVEFINGSRYLPGPIRPLSSYRRYLANRFFTWLTSILINVKLTDMACGYKLISKRLLNEIEMKENRFGFEAELILKALRIKKNNIAEVPVRYFPRNKGEGKKLNNLDAWKILWTIAKYGLFKLK